MAGHGLTFIFAIILWWLSTGIILVVCGLPKRTFGWSLLGGGAVLTAAVYGLVQSAGSVSAMGAYVAFLSAIGVWGCLEMTFLMGYVTGPLKTGCPPQAKGWQRFWLALKTLLYHELAIVAAGIGVTLLAWGGPNQTGPLTFLILMVMRISAKLNIFLGVPHLPEAMLPERLSYLKSYFRTRRVNPLFPFSILVSTLAAIFLGQRALQAEGAEAVGAALLFALLLLAILEHLFMILPLPDAALWRWARPLAPPEPIEKPSR